MRLYFVSRCQLVGNQWWPVLVPSPDCRSRCLLQREERGEGAAHESSDTPWFPLIPQQWYEVWRWHFQSLFRCFLQGANIFSASLVPNTNTNVRSFIGHQCLIPQQWCDMRCEDDIVGPFSAVFYKVPIHFPPAWYPIQTLMSHNSLGSWVWHETCGQQRSDNTAGFQSVSSLYCGWRCWQKIMIIFRATRIDMTISLCQLSLTCIEGGWGQLVYASVTPSPREKKLSN